MMMSIFAAIEKLVDTVRPQRLLFIAIDGVAPRAKMNQQRQRRFKSATSRQVAAKVAADPSTIQLPKADAAEAAAAEVGHEAFDSNCITPGTHFMQTLDEYLVYFIQVCRQRKETKREMTLGCFGEVYTDARFLFLHISLLLPTI